MPRGRRYSSRNDSFVFDLNVITISSFGITLFRESTSSISSSLISLKMYITLHAKFLHNSAFWWYNLWHLNLEEGQVKPDNKSHYLTIY